MRQRITIIFNTPGSPVLPEVVQSILRKALRDYYDKMRAGPNSPGVDGYSRRESLYRGEVAGLLAGADFAIRDLTPAQLDKYYPHHTEET